MNDIKDLNLQTEILPLFDYTLNDFAKETLYQLFQEPLSTIADIEKRQETFKGFIANSEIFNNYSYSRLDFHEVYRFLNDTSYQNNVQASKMRLLFLENERHQTRARFIQFVLLFHKLQITYLKRINIGFFPEDYKKELILLFNFFTSFNLKYYDELVREGKFKTKHILALAKVISGKQITGELDVFYKRLFQFEAYLSISKCIIKHHFCFPSFSKSHLLFESVYHPLLKNPVKNSFSIDKNVILLTGPNMSGKSTLLKSIGLCIHLALLGVAVPATKAELPFFERISISINHNDDISSGYSHFMNEIFRLKQVVVDASENKSCFAVFDELFKGTNIDDAVQICSTTIKGLTRFKNSFFFISTHLHQLKQVEQVQTKQVGTYYVDCDIKNSTPIFNYEVKEGWSDLKVGQLLFEKEGLNELLHAP
jgi:DNA mismatch repair protein MutS